MEDAQDQDARDRDGVQHRPRRDDNREAGQKGKGLGDDDGAEALLLLQFSDGHEHPRHEHPRHNGDQVARHRRRPQLVEKEERDPAQHHEHHGEVPFPDLLPEKQRRKDQDEHRCGKLQHNGVGRGGQLVGHGKAEVDTARQNAGRKGLAVHGKVIAFKGHIGRNGQPGNQAAEPGDCEAVPGQELDEDSRDAPQHGAENHLQDPDLLFFHFPLRPFH